MPVFRGLSLFLIVLTLSVPVAQAQVSRTFVSTTGSDANTGSLCSHANPCRSFGAAQTVTTAGGEIIVLSSGGYGPVEITKSLQIVAPSGVHAAITATAANAIATPDGTAAIYVNAAATDAVVLRGLSITNLAEADGIYASPAVSLLHVENCFIRRARVSIWFRQAAPLEESTLAVRNTVIQLGTQPGIFVSGTGARARIASVHAEKNGTGIIVHDLAQADVVDTILAGNSWGLLVGGGARVSATRTTAAANLTFGFDADGGRLALTDSVATHTVRFGSSAGVRATGTGGIVRVIRTTAAHNLYGFVQEAPAAFESLGGNMVRDNATNKAGTISAGAPD